MKLPANQRLPFFAYGVFKPGELAFLKIKNLVIDCTNCSISGTIRIRDGLPIASLGDHGEIRGTLIRFHAGSEGEAYGRIADLEPDKQYYWATVPVGSNLANVLAGKSPDKGSQEPEEEWSGCNDPLFTVALDVVAETLEDNRICGWGLKPLFRLEMAYLLLWTSIERYTSLRYCLSGNSARSKVLEMANEPAYQKALLDHVKEDRALRGADNPKDKYELNNLNPRKSLEYYYQVRCNAIHRGKGIPLDHERLEKSIDELLEIFRITLNAAFVESQWETATS